MKAKIISTPKMQIGSMTSSISGGGGNGGSINGRRSNDAVRAISKTNDSELK